MKAERQYYGRKPKASAYKEGGGVPLRSGKAAPRAAHDTTDPYLRGGPGNPYSSAHIGPKKK